jgi:hypothetical protein
LSVSWNITAQQEVEILSPPQGGVYKWHGGTCFIYSKGLHSARSYQHTLDAFLMKCQSVYFNMPSSYTSDDDDAKSVVIKTSSK